MDKKDGKLGLLTNFFIQHAVTIFVIATASCLVLIAYLTNHLNPPVIGVWLVVGILTSLLLSGVALVVVLAVAAVEKVRHMRIVTFEPQEHPAVKDRFVRERVKAEDFHLLASLVNENKYFESCEIHGRGSMHFQGSNHVEGCSFYLCDIVIVKNADKINTSSQFIDSTFKDRTFTNMVIWLTEDMAGKMLRNAETSGESLNIVGFQPNQLS